MQFVRFSDAQRLSTCVIQFNLEPVYIEFVDQPSEGVYVAHGFKLDGRGAVSIDLTKDTVHPPKFVLGYTNVWRNKQLSVVQTFRNPARRTSLGICSSNTYFQELEPDPNARSPTWQNVFLGTGFVNAQKDDYPSLKQVVEFSKGAISPEFALSQATLNAFRVFWEGKIIGEYNSKEDIIELYPPYSWALESLERLMTKKQEKTRVTLSA